MDAQRFDRMTKAAATGMSRRQVLRSVLAVAGGGELVHITGGESGARTRCCRQAKRAAQQGCFERTGGACPFVIDFACEKTGPGTCQVIRLACVDKDGNRCG